MLDTRNEMLDDIDVDRLLDLYVEEIEGADFAADCYGTFGTYGCACGCLGTFGTFGCAGCGG